MFKDQQSFYKSKEWVKFRNVIISERTQADGYVYCDMCHKPILKRYDLIIDHITELTDDNVNDISISLNPDNVRCLHFECHNKRHERFGKQNYMNRTKQVHIIYGAPCSGKSTYVYEHAGANDLVVDMDSIYSSISINERYNKPDRLNAAAFAVRDCLYDIIKYRSGRWQDAYIIAGVPRSGDRQRLKERVNADDLIFIDASRDDCLDRAADRPGEWKKYIDDWFDAHEK